MEPPVRLRALKEHLAAGKQFLKEEHLAGQSGVDNAFARSEFLDGLMRLLFAMAEGEGGPSKLALVANGGYGRGYLNPGSDLDILILLPRAATKLGKTQRAFIDRILYPLWDLGFKVGHASRSSRECIAEAQDDPHTRTTLFDSRLLAGDEKLFKNFQEAFRREVIIKRRDHFLEDRRADLTARYRTYSNTVFLQEPNLKESPGALRDFHNLLWISDALFETRDLTTLSKRGLLCPEASQELAEGFEFLMRVRNDLHYREGPTADVLTLRRQGPAANFLGYPNRNLLKRIEALMRDYYQHARRIRQHTQTIFEISDLEKKIHPKNVFGKPAEVKPDRVFDHFYAIDKRLFAKDENIFQEQPEQLLKVFRLCQIHNYRPSPDLRRLLKSNRDLIDRPFRVAKINRKTFQTILTQKGKVGYTLRLMHRVGILGRYLPEFGKMESLVQHEFFHRYTADEHTLRGIDQRDAVLESDEPRTEKYRKILIDHQDPYALYLGLIMHDSGRAMGVEEHIDGSAILTDRVCRRLAISGDRRKLIIFLVDQHLALFSTATRQDLSDPDTISAFARQMKTKHNLDSLLVFTFADANGTNEEAWSSWKESLMLQLYRATRTFLVKGEAKYDAAFRQELKEVREKVTTRVSARYQHLVDDHFEQMPKRYFRFRNARSIRQHIRALGQLQERRKRRPDTPFECSVQWIEHPSEGYSELIIALENRPGLLRRVSCALAAHDINILSADAFTRNDGVVLDLFRVTTDDHEAVIDKVQQLSFVTTFYELSSTDHYDSAAYLAKPKNYLDDDPITEFSVPVRALVDNDRDPIYSVVEIQAVDRIALLHEIMEVIDRNELAITHARICTEKGVALDSFYLLDRNNKPLDETTARKLEEELAPVIAKQQ
jgi:[protein-PII] uridylyltransferase